MTASLFPVSIAEIDFRARGFFGGIAVRSLATFVACNVEGRREGQRVFYVGRERLWLGAAAARVRLLTLSKLLPGPLCGVIHPLFFPIRG